MQKLDLRQQLKNLYQPSARQVAEALFSVSYTAKFMMKEGTRAEGLCRDAAPIVARTGLRGSHHEIHLTDIRRADPSRWKTVLRQPMG